MAQTDVPDLQPGDSSEYVHYLQQMLNHHYQESVVPESGEFDDTTANAIEHFRAQNGLVSGSTVDHEVWAALRGQSSHPDAATSAAAEQARIDLSQFPELFRAMFTETEQYVEYLAAVEEHGAGTTMRNSGGLADPVGGCADEQATLHRAQAALFVAALAVGHAPGPPAVAGLLVAIANLIDAAQRLQRCQDSTNLLALVETMELEYQYLTEVAGA